MNKIVALLLSFIILGLPVCTFAQEDITSTEIINDSAEVSQELPYNYESTYYIPIKMNITTPITTKGETLTEGQLIQFKVSENAYHNKKVFIKRGTLVNAKIETIITSGMNGFPAEIIVGNFEIPGTRPSQLVDTYTKKGQNRCYIVYPIKWALTIIPFVGSLTNFIKGGHARIKAKDEVVIYYYPDWK